MPLFNSITIDSDFERSLQQYSYVAPKVTNPYMDDLMTLQLEPTSADNQHDTVLCVDQNVNGDFVLRHQDKVDNEDSASLSSPTHHLHHHTDSSASLSPDSSNDEPSAHTFLIDAATLISQAQSAETAGDYDVAFESYKCVIGILIEGVKKEANSSHATAIKHKIHQYLKRAEDIQRLHLASKIKTAKNFSLVSWSRRNSKIMFFITIVNQVTVWLRPWFSSWSSYELNVVKLSLSLFRFPVLISFQSSSVLFLSVQESPYRKVFASEIKLSNAQSLAKFKLLGVCNRVQIVFDSINRQKLALKLVHKFSDVPMVSQYVFPKDIPNMMQPLQIQASSHTFYLFFEYSSVFSLSDAIRVAGGRSEMDRDHKINAQLEIINQRPTSSNSSRRKSNNGESTTTEELEADGSESHPDGFGVSGLIRKARRLLLDVEQTMRVSRVEQERREEKSTRLHNQQLLSQVLQRTCPDRNGLGNREPRILFNESLVRQWMRQLIEGLQHLHRLQVIYVRLCPDKILLSEDLQQARLAYVWTLDKQQLPRPLSPLSLVLAAASERSNARCMPYLAPEVLTSHDEPGPEADWWSIGLIAYELLTNRVRLLKLLISFNFNFIFFFDTASIVIFGLHLRQRTWPSISRTLVGRSSRFYFEVFENRSIGTNGLLRPGRTRNASLLCVHVKSQSHSKLCIWSVTSDRLIVRPMTDFKRC